VQRGIIFITTIVLVCNFQIHSQEKGIELKSINFSGNEWFSNSDLESVIQSKENPWWFYRFINSIFSGLGSPPSYFDSSSIAIDIISLKSFYTVNGFFVSRFDYNYSLDTVGRSAELNFQIKENNFCKYGKITLHGLNSLNEYNQGLIKSYITFPEDKRYQQDEVQEKITGLIHTLKNIGYMFADFDSTLINIDTVDNKVNLDYYFTLGKFYTFNEIIVEKSGEGKDLVNDDLIKYIAGISVGDTYREDYLASSRLRLARTGLFNSVNVKGNEKDTVKNKVPLLITGSIGPMYELSPEIFGDNELNTFNAGIGAAFIKKNFFGDARKLTLRTRLRVNDITKLRPFKIFSGTEKIQTEIDLSMIIEQPYLFSRRLSGRLETYFKSYNISIINYNNAGAIFSSSLDLPSYTFINLVNPYIRLDNLDWKVIVPDTTAPYTAAISTLTTSLGSEIGSNNVDDIFFPRNGYISSLIAEISSSNVSRQIPDSSSSEVGYYYKLQLNLGYFLSLSNDRNTILGLKFKTGYIQMIKGGSALVAPNQTFFAGGSNSVRGWKARDLAPLDPVDYIGAPALTESGTTSTRLRGGTFLTEGSVEYRRRFKETYGFVTFMDYGNTWNGYKKAKLDQVAVAVGFGLRYYSSIAPFRLDFGFKFYDPYDQKLIFKKKVLNSLSIHFGIGEAF
jgi:outer membrane protein assembly factor BamA